MYMWAAKHRLMPPRVLSLMAAGLLVAVRSVSVLSRNTHLLILRATARISLLWLANVVSAILVGVAAVALRIVEVDIDGSRALSALAGQLRIAGLEFFRLVDLVKMFFEKTDVLAVALDGSICEIADEGYKTDDEVDGEVEDHHKEDARWETAFDLLHFPDQVQ